MLDKGGIPRYRWDQLLVLAWRTYLPLVLAGVFFITVIFIWNTSVDFSQHLTEEYLLFFIVSSKTTLKNKRENIFIKRSFMSSVRGVANRTSLINNKANLSPIRRSLCFHAGTIKPNAMPKLYHADPTNKHQLVFKTTCSENSCNNTNCANAQNPNVNCPGRTALQNQTSIPPTQNGFSTNVVGNMTTIPPQGHPNITLETTRNYSGFPQQQSMVIEKPNSTPVNSSDITLNNKATTFVQEQKHHDDIQQNT